LLHFTYALHRPDEQKAKATRIRPNNTPSDHHDCPVGDSVSDLSYVTSFAVTRVARTALSSVTDEDEVTTTGGTTLRYDHSAGQFVQNWKLPSTKNLCYLVQVSVLGAAEPLTAYVMTR
jgi:hypothetical protein